MSPRLVRLVPALVLAWATAATAAVQIRAQFESAVVTFGEAAVLQVSVLGAANDVAEPAMAPSRGSP